MARSLPERLISGREPNLVAVREDAAARIMTLEAAMILIEGRINKASVDAVEDPSECLSRIQDIVRSVVPDAHKHIKARW